MKSQQASAPKQTPLNLQELKRQVGITPFSERIQIDSDGYSGCPFHNGDSNKSFHIVQKESGVFIGTCFSECGKSFDAIDFVAKHDGIGTGEAIQKLKNIVSDNGEVPATILHKPKPATPMTAEQWAKSGRAVTDQDVAKLAASRPNSLTPTAATLNETGFRIATKGGNTYLVAPYRLGDTFYTLKARNLATKEFIQENPVSQKGLFNIDAVTPGCDVYVVESELDAAVLHANGHVAVSVINATQKAIELEVLKKLTTARRIFLVGDQDGAGQVCMTNIAALLPAEKVFRLSFADAKDVGELAKQSELMADFKETWEQLKADALASWVTHNIPFISQLPDKRQEWIIDRLLPRNGYLLVTAKFGATKSLSALCMGWGIESGTSVFGRKVSRKTPVLYVDRENPLQTINDRRSHLGIPENQIRYWGDWIDGMETPNLDDPRLAEFAVREQGVIIFDSLTDWLEGVSENDPSKMTEVARKFRRLARLGAGVIVLHHDNKNGVGYRGTTAIPAGSDMAIKLDKDELTKIVQIRTERFRMCDAWEIDIQYDFKAEPWTCTVLKDNQSTDSYKEKIADENETIRVILADHHERNKGAGISQAQLQSLLAAQEISKRRSPALLAAGTKSGQWRTEIGSRNAVLYFLNGWEPNGVI
ncbi:MAG TPA: AAA family ATPase [Candidatus Acidoferrales bacterium]|nr:AAA family ATPase [Candidatus Acidoferrales bacterium]